MHEFTLLSFQEASGTEVELSMALTLSFDDLGSWDDLDIVSPVTEDEEVQDPRTM